LSTNFMSWGTLKDDSCFSQYLLTSSGDNFVEDLAVSIEDVRGFFAHCGYRTPARQQ
jgi:hypothetical protein